MTCPARLRFRAHIRDYHVARRKPVLPKISKIAIKRDDGTTIVIDFRGRDERPTGQEADLGR